MVSPKKKKESIASEMEKGFRPFIPKGTTKKYVLPKEDNSIPFQLLQQILILYTGKGSKKGIDS